MFSLLHSHCDLFHLLCISRRLTVFCCSCIILILVLEVLEGIGELACLIEYFFGEAQHLSYVDTVGAIDHTLLDFVEHGELFAFSQSPDIEVLHIG